tara:strand:- start:7105 stop:7791 length:687 start_codon:yes stop_codon:yes gene_type:complete
MNSSTQKIIFLGFQKTATVSLHKSFIKSGLKSCHGIPGNNLKAIKKCLLKNDVLSDWYERHISIDSINYIYNLYPKSLFILNTRPLNQWIESRFKHFYFRAFVKKIDPPTTDYFDPLNFSSCTAEGFIKQRCDFYQQCFDFFKGKNNFSIIDISKEFSSFLSEVTGVDSLSVNRYNTRLNQELPLNFMKKINLIGEDLSTKYSKNLIRTPLTLDKDLNENLKTFKNNL